MDFQLETKTFEKNHKGIHYYMSGNKSGETIVFLHPAFGDHTCFYKQIDFFAPTYQIITLDMPGHGQTGNNTKDKIDSVPLRITEIMQAENIEKVHVVGVSMGSLVAQYFALKYPEKTLSLTVLGGYSINKKQGYAVKEQRKEMLKWIFKMIFSMDAFRKYVSSVSAFNKDEQMRLYESSKHFTRKSFSAMSGMNKLVEDRPNFKHSYPFLLLVGEKDIELALTETKQWHEENPESEFHMIENAGHCANMDNAEKFNELLINFLRKL